MNHLNSMKEDLFDNLTGKEREQVERLMGGYHNLLGAIVESNLSDRETMLAVSHTLVRCAKIVGCPKERMLDELGKMFDLTTLVESEHEGALQ